LEDQTKFKKYQWIDIDLIRNEKDFRPESFRPAHPDFSDVEIKEFVDTRDKWRERRKWCCKNVYTSIQTLIEDSREPKNMSLATFKPKRIIDFTTEQVERERKTQWRELQKQGDLFAERKNRDPIRKLPYKFKYHLKDEDGRESKLAIEDWEIGALYWNCLAHAEGDEGEAITKVRQKYFEEFSRYKDLHLFLGTTEQYHRRRMTNPFTIIGVFYPPIQQQLSFPF